MSPGGPELVEMHEGGCIGNARTAVPHPCADVVGDVITEGASDPHRSGTGDAAGLAWEYDDHIGVGTGVQACAGNDIRGRCEGLNAAQLLEVVKTWVLAFGATIPAAAHHDLRPPNGVSNMAPRLSRHRDPPFPPYSRCYCMRMSADKKACTFGVQSQYVEMAVEVFTLLADATRVRIILALRDGEKSVSELAEAAEKSPTAVSQHLAKLRWGRIVSTRQEGTRVFYRLVDEHARRLVAHAVYQAEHALEVTPAHHRAEAVVEDLEETLAETPGAS